MTDFIDWLGSRIAGVGFLVLIYSAAVAVLALAWCLANWHDPGLVTLKSVLGVATETPADVVSAVQ